MIRFFSIVAALVLAASRREQASILHIHWSRRSVLAFGVAVAAGGLLSAFLGVADASVVLSPGNHYTAAYDLTGPPNNGPYTGVIFGYDDSSNPSPDLLDNGTSFHVDFFDSTNALLGGFTLTNTFGVGIVNVEATAGDLFGFLGTTTSDPVGHFVLTPIDDAFSVNTLNVAYFNVNNPLSECCSVFATIRASDLRIVAIPEPSSIALFILAVALLALCRTRRPYMRSYHATSIAPTPRACRVKRLAA